jgi:2-methylcitrate dehydratase PrpD
VLAGYQVAARLGIAMDGTPAGVHDIATWGTVGAAAGVAHLLSGGDGEVIARAIDLAGSLPVLPDATTVFDGSAGQHLYLGVGASLGVLHGQSAMAGIRPVPGTLERHFARWSANDPDRVASLAARCAGPPVWTVLDGYLKRHPTCGLLHGVNDAVEDLVPAGGIPAARIASARVLTYRAAASFDDPAPGTDLAARFSIPWTVAAALTFGALDHRAFAEPALQDADLLALAARVKVLHDPAMDAGYPAGRPSSVTVVLTDGSRLTARCDLPRGDGLRAGDDQRVRGKPLDLLTRAVDEGWARRLLATVEQLDTVQAAELGRVLTVPLTGTAA